MAFERKTFVKKEAPKAVAGSNQKVGRLSVKPAGEETPQNLTGLFTSVSKKSGKSYISGTDKEGGVKYMVFPGTKDKPDTLFASPIGDKDAKMEKICDLGEKKTAKSGMQYQSGKDAEGNEFIIFFS